MNTKTRLSLFSSLLLIGLLALITTGTDLGDEPPTATAPNDMEIAHIAYTAGILDIRYAHLALAISENPDVQAFAETMIRDHTAVNEKAVALLQQLKATPQDNPTSQKLIQDAAKIRKELMALEGATFDKRYAANELAYHQFVNQTVENQFIPAVRNPQFKSLLASALRTFKVHEQHAEKLNSSLNQGEM
ncbi:MAG TPA: DUF4142 domain-containing protein [Rhodothermales bacterium]|nr:DUF4142 domain-containing protein [Rhodothermales bacterium]